MKKLLIAFTLTVIMGYGVSAQRRLSNMINLTNGGSASLVEKMGKKESENATGTPYVLPAASLGTINGVQDLILVKYNAYADEIELDNGDGKTFILPKTSEFNTITLKVGTVYKYAEYKNADGKNVKGYLIEKASKDDVTLLKKETIILIPEKQPMNGYGTYAPPKYERASDEFYLQLKNKTVISFPKSKKKLQELFPDQKEKIDSYLKENDLSFKKETDMIKITQFLATLS